MNRETRLAENEKYFRKLAERTAAKNKETYTADATRLELEKQRREELTKKYMEQSAERRRKEFENNYADMTPQYSEELRTEYDRIKNNFLKVIREKILILYQTVDQCEIQCKSGCESNYIRNRLNRIPEVEGGAPPSIFSITQGSSEDSTDEDNADFSTSDSSPGFFGRIMRKYLANDKRTTSDSTTSDSASDSASDSGSVFNFVNRKIDYYKERQANAKELDDNWEAEQFCDKQLKDFNNVHTQICSMPDRISSESTQGICKLAIKLRTEIDELFKLYKADIASDAEKIAEQKDEFLREVGRKVGGSKKTQKRRQHAKKR